MPTNPPPYTPCAYEPIKYGDYTFSAYTKSSLNKQNVYSDDGLTVKWVKCTLEVEFYISQELCFYTGAQSTSGVDEELDAIREALMQPYRQMAFWFHGAGVKLNIKGKMNDSTPGSLNSASDPYYIQYNLIDGPFPEILTWEPLGINNAVKCRWRCVFNIPYNNIFECGSKIKYSDLYKARQKIWGFTDDDFDDLTWLLNKVLNDLKAESSDPDVANLSPENFLMSFTEEQEIDIDEDGCTVVSFIGVMEFTSSGAMFIANKGQKTAVTALLQVMALYFEPLHPIGFTRSQKYRFRKNKREIEFVITDREIKSDNPILPNIITADVTHSVSSELLSDDVFSGAGFLTWQNNFEGTIKVRPGVWKGWAWVAMMTIVLQRIRRTSPIARGATDQSLKDEVDGVRKVNEQQNNNDKKITPKHILTSIRISEKIYSREVSFELSYMIMSSLADLFSNTGLFYPVHILWESDDNFTQDPFKSLDWGKVPNNPRTQRSLSYRHEWQISNEYLTNAQNAFGYRGPILANHHVIFNPYDCANINQKWFLTAPRTQEQKESIGNYNRNVEAREYNSAKNVEQFALRRRTKNSNTVHPQWGPLNVVTPSHSTPDKTPGDDSTKNPTNSIIEPTAYKYPGTDDNTANWMANRDPKDTWISYEPKFELIRNNNSVLMPSIKSKNPDSVYNANAYPLATNKAWKGFTILGQSTAEQASEGYPSGSDSSRYMHDNVQVFGEPTTFVRFYGSAMRAGYPIPTPSLVGTNAPDNNPASLVRAYLVGTSVWKHAQVVQSADIPIFAATWDLVYALKGDPVCANITFQTYNTGSRYL